MSEKSILCTGNLETGRVQFTAGSAFSSANFFQNVTSADSSYDFSGLTVWINGVATSQSADSISASANDVIEIVAKAGIKFPWFGKFNDGGDEYGIDYIKSIDTPLPPMFQADGSPVYSYTYAFQGCTLLESVPAGFLSNNTQIVAVTHLFEGCTSLTSLPENFFGSSPKVSTLVGLCYGCSNLQTIPSDLFAGCTFADDFTDCFYNCSVLQAIPAGLFADCESATDFSYTFQNCNGITSLPDGLFSNCPNVIYFSYLCSGCASLASVPLTLFALQESAQAFNRCFAWCGNLTPVVQIGTLASTVDVDDFALDADATGTVYVHAGTAAYTAFTNSTTSNVTVQTY